jgi:hypothetical protein
MFANDKPEGSGLINFFKSAVRSLVPSTETGQPTDQELIDIEFMRIERRADAVLAPKLKKLYEEYNRAEQSPLPTGADGAGSFNLIKSP